MPHTVQAIFYMADGSAEDEAHARRIHKDFAAYYAVSPHTVPLLRLSLSNPQSPFEASSGPLSPRKCDAALADPHGKFFQMWGGDAWHLRRLNQRACWEDHSGGPGSFFSGVFEGDGCDTNWFEGASGALGEQVWAQAINGNQRHSAALSGTQRHSAALSGTQRHSAANSGTQRYPAALSGNQRQSAALSGTQRHSAALSGTLGKQVSAANQWQSVAIGGSQLQSMALSGNRWQSTLL
jgi:hypothetical protein